MVPGEEACHAVPGQVVDPALEPELRHDGVDPGEPGPGLAPGHQLLGVVVPVDLPAHLVALKTALGYTFNNNCKRGREKLVATFAILYSELRLNG